MGTARRDEEDEETPVIDDDVDPESGARVKRKPGDAIQLLVAELRGRARGLEGAALDAECDRFVERVIERHVAVAPERLKVTVRQTLRRHLETDPAFVGLIGDLRAAARRG